MHRRLFAFLFILLCIISFNTKLSFAQSTNKSYITLNSKTETLNLNKNIYITPDQDNKYNAKDITLRFQNNVRGNRNKNTTLNFGKQYHPHWIAFEVKNLTTIKNWFLDFGTLDNGRSGILQKLMVYSGSQKKILYDSIQKTSNDISESGLMVEIKPNSTSIFVIYLDPTDHKRLSLNLSLNNIQKTKLPKFSFKKTLLNNINIIIILSICLSVIGLIASKSVGFIPIIAYYIGQLIWFQYIETPVSSSFPKIALTSSILPILNAITIAITCILTIPGQYKDSALRIILFFMGGLSICGMTLIILFIPIGSSITNIISNSLNLITLIVAVAFLATRKDPHIKLFASYISIWVGLILFSEIIRITTSLDMFPNSFITTNIDYLILYPQLILIYLTVIISIKIHQNLQIGRVIRQAQKTQSLLKAQKSKESSDHSRLLRVIEREREIMEELRERESERAEEMRQAKVSADDANHAKSAFLAVVSHEIRTPMTGVMGMIRLLENTPLSEEQKDYVLTIKDSGDAMVSLLNDILDFSKIEDGGMRLEKINFDLQRVTKSVIMLMKGHATQKNIDLILDIHEDVPTTLYGDPTRLRQIFLNLIGNALKFTSKGHVALRIKIDPDKNNYGEGIFAVNFIIEDTGIGISEEAQKNLFNPFSQADSSIARKYGGTGLGLVICQRLVEAMDGEIKITSREGSGTSFFFTIPLKSENNQFQSEEIKELKEISTIDEPKHFLIVDDNEVNRKVITALLSQKNHIFTTAENGTTALETLKNNNNFDGIFLDIEMPDINGKEVARTILKNESTCNIPIIALTGNVSDDNIIEYKQIGFKGHLAKPINPNTLYDIISNINAMDMNNTETKQPIIEIKKEVAKPSNKIKETLDHDLLKGLKDGLGITQTKSLLNDLFEKTDEIIEQIKKSIEDNNEDDLGARAHELKGMAGNFGLKAVSDKSAQIEKDCRDGKYDQETMFAYKKDLSILFERSKIALDKFLDS